MGSDDAFRACDADRERAVEVIREGYVSGRLTHAEFDERTTAAFAARTWGDLRRLIADLPTGAEPGPVVPRPSGERGHGGGTPGEERQGRGFPVPVLPIALLWLIATLSLHSPTALIPIVFLAMIALRWVSGFRDCGDGRDPPHERDPRPQDPRREQELWREHDLRHGQAARRRQGGPS